MNSFATRRSGRPSTTVLSATKITRTAHKLLAKNGNFTMGSLAKELRVAPSSLYNHFHSKDEVLGAVSDAVISEINVAPLKKALHTLTTKQLSTESKSKLWIDVLAEWGKSYRLAFSESADLTAALALTPVERAPQTLEMYELLVQTLQAFGCPNHRTLVVIETLESFLLGAALDANAPQYIFDPAAASESYPALKTAYETLRQTTNSPADEAFTLGLEAILHGLARQVISDNSEPKT